MEAKLMGATGMGIEDDAKVGVSAPFGEGGFAVLEVYFLAWTMHVVGSKREGDSATMRC